MKPSVFFLVALVASGSLSSCKKNNVDNLVGTHKFTGIDSVKYIFTGFINFPPAEVDSAPETLTTVISRPGSKDSSDYILLPVTFYDGPFGIGIPFLSFSTVPDQGTIPVAIQITDTILTIPFQLPGSGSDLSIDGGGSLVGNKLTISYHTDYRNYNKYSTIVTIL
jgi:hypothetical protein